MSGVEVSLRDDDSKSAQRLGVQNTGLIGHRMVDRPQSCPHLLPQLEIKKQLLDQIAVVFHLHGELTVHHDRQPQPKS